MPHHTCPRIALASSSLEQFPTFFALEVLDSFQEHCSGVLQNTLQIGFLQWGTPFFKNIVVGHLDALVG